LLDRLELFDMFDMYRVGEGGIGLSLCTDSIGGRVGVVLLWPSTLVVAGALDFQLPYHPLDDLMELASELGASATLAGLFMDFVDGGRGVAADDAASVDLSSVCELSAVLAVEGSDAFAAPPPSRSVEALSLRAFLRGPMGRLSKMDSK
jgi:hypothetical protein